MESDFFELHSEIRFAFFERFDFEFWFGEEGLKIQKFWKNKFKNMVWKKLQSSKRKKFRQKKTFEKGSSKGAKRPKYFTKVHQKMQEKSSLKIIKKKTKMFPKIQK